MAKCLLDELNLLLRKTKLNIPEYAREVHATGKNYKWLKKNFASNESTPIRIRELLNISLNELTKPF